MIPVIALVGRPNVGKSTLFNYLTRSQNALVANEPGVTRDRQYGAGYYLEHSFIVIDTGGLEEKSLENGKLADLSTAMQEQVWKAVTEANVVFWLVDARSGLLPQDEQILARLRLLNKPVYVLVNKTDGIQTSVACLDFYALGWKKLYPIAAIQGLGIHAVLAEALTHFPVVSPDEAKKDEEGIKVAIIGRPNVGKSTLVNRVLGEDRLVASDIPGTTRDTIKIRMKRRHQIYTLMDTAGVRRRRSIELALEKFSVIKTLRAIESAEVVVLVVDAQQNITDQDLHLLGYVIQTGKSLVIAVNKWDGLSESERDAVRKALDRRLNFVSYAKIQCISALQGSGMGDLFKAIDQAHRSATQKLSTPQLTAILERAVASHQPPVVQGRRIKLRYAHPGGENPPVIVIHGNQTQNVPLSYQRYLANYYRQALKLVGTPIRLELKSGDNPFAGRKNTLTDRQVKRRQRLMRHVKK